jgi:hypothetical protein
MLIRKSATTFNIAKLSFRNNVPGSASRVPAGRSAPIPGQSHRKQTRCWKRFAAFLGNLFRFHTNL